MTNRRKALCVGINNFQNYPSAALRGCINDVNDMANILEEFYDFTECDIIKLMDTQATKENIMKHLESMISDAKEGKYDYLVFSMSSHGTQVPDVSEDEPDRLDEAFCPYDLAEKDGEWDSAHIIVDDEFRDLFAQLPENVQLEVFLDTCHSGTGLRAVDILFDRKPRYLPPPSLKAFNKLVGRRSRGLREAMLERKKINNILWAACRSDQTSADAKIGENWHGAFTYYFCNEIRDSKNKLPRSKVLDKVRADLIEGSYSQTPQLEGEEPVPIKLKKWTVLIYMGGDNNLDQEGVKDLEEMAKVGSDENINIVAQFDRAGAAGTQRFYITKDGGYDKDSVANLGETNCGDPEVLTDFLKWGVITYPAEHYMVVLWNHGSGWKEDDIYNRVMKLGPEGRNISSFETRKISRASIRRSFFNTTIEEITKLEEFSRGIAYDDESKDFLDNKELKNALNSALQQTNVDKFDIIGFDACLMSMIEVAYQIKDSVKIVVGSEETEPGEGWPYDTVLEAITKNPLITPTEFANTIVDKYVESYDVGPRSDPVTQSALNLEKIDDVKERIDKLAHNLIRDIQNEIRAVSKSFSYAQRYSDYHYLDLYNFAEHIKEESSNDEVKANTQNLMNVLAMSSDNFIINSKNLTSFMKNSHGVSIYFPGRFKYSSFYDNLEMSRKGKWDDFIKAYQEEYDRINW